MGRCRESLNGSADAPQTRRRLLRARFFQNIFYLQNPRLHFSTVNHAVLFSPLVVNVNAADNRFGVFFVSVNQLFETRLAVSDKQVISPNDREGLIADDVTAVQNRRSVSVRTLLADVDEIRHVGDIFYLLPLLVFSLFF